MNRQPRTAPSSHGPVVLLAGQAFALGLALAWITIPASAIFLAAYGPELLPVTYIGAAGTGALSSVLLARAVRRRPLSRVAGSVLTGLTGALLVSWVLLSRAGTDWVSFALLVVVPLVVPVGFLFVVGQAGLLLDVRALKALYARVVAGFALGVVSGGLLGPPLLDALGATHDLLAGAATATGLMLALVVVARRRHPRELSVVERDEQAAPRPTLRAVLANRFVVLVVTFQVLSAIESQWLDFLVFDRAAQRYEDSAELARFVSRFAAIAYGVDILFLLLLAGLLLRRFGLRYGLTANSLGVLLLVAAVIVATAVQGTGATSVFVLVVAARVVDLTFSDGASRTSLSAAYQAVPGRLRPVAQATVEGLAVPLAIGLSGIVLLVLDSIGRAEGLLLPVLTAVVVVAWLVTAMALYRSYGSSLLASLRGRTLDPAELTVDDESSLVVIDRLVESDDERDVRLGLDILTVAEHPALSVRLEQLAGDGRAGVRTDVLERLRLVAPHLAAEAARAGLADPSPAVRAASVRVLAAAGAPSDAVRVVACQHDPSPDVRVAVAVALSTMDQTRGADRVRDEVARLAVSSTADDRVLAAQMLAGCEAALDPGRGALDALLADPEATVVIAALSALRWPDDADHLPAAGGHIRDRRTAEAAVEALVRAGPAALALVDAGLSDASVDRRSQELFVRVARGIGGAAAVAVLRQHIEHGDPEIGLAVMRALGVLGQGAGPSPTLEQQEISVIARDAEHAAHVLRALVAFEHEPSTDLLRSALQDELDLVRKRVIAALSMRHGTAGLDRVAFQLSQRDERSHALAIEWLDITLTGSERAVVALLEPNLAWRDRLRRLNRAFPLEVLNARAVLLEVVRDDGRRWRPWMKACAVHAASLIAPADLLLLGEVAEASTPTDRPEAALLHETVADFRVRELGLV